MRGADDVARDAADAAGWPTEPIIQVYQGTLLVGTYRLTSRA